MRQCAWSNPLISSLSLMLWVGCIMPLPRHVPMEAGTRGPIEAEHLAFLEVGSTTKEEVALKLGEPDHVFKEGREFVYRWESIAGGWAWGTPYGGGDGDLGEMISSVRIEFDEKGVLSAIHRDSRRP